MQNIKFITIDNRSIGVSDEIYKMHQDYLALQKILVSIKNIIANSNHHEKYVIYRIEDTILQYERQGGDINA